MPYASSLGQLKFSLGPACAQIRRTRGHCRRSSACATSDDPPPPRSPASATGLPRAARGRTAAGAPSLPRGKLRLRLRSAFRAYYRCVRRRAILRQTTSV
jgi:hypothetical protein